VLVILVARQSLHRTLRPAISFGPQTHDFVRLAIPGLIANGMPQLTVIAGVMAASTSPSAISWLYYAQRLVELPLGLVGIAVGTVLIPALSRGLNANDRSEVAAAESRGLELSLGLALPAAIALAVLAEPIVRTLFERGAFTSADSAATASALAIFAIGLPGHILVKTWSPLFFARGDTRTPMLAGLLGLAIASLGSFALMPVIGHVGVALAIAGASWVSAAMLAILIRRRIGFFLEPNTRRRLVLIVLAGIVMGAAVQALTWLLQSWFMPGTHALPKLMALGCIVAGGIGIYGLTLWTFGVARWSDLKASLRRPR
jgi:putative peptidoglycan lipid II flippase